MSFTEYPSCMHASSKLAFSHYMSLQKQCSCFDCLAVTTKFEHVGIKELSAGSHYIQRLGIANGLSVHRA